MRDSYSLVEAKAKEINADILLLSEPNKTQAKQRNWHADGELNTAIITLSDRIKLSLRGSGNGFTWIETDGFRIYSCYISPNVDLELFEDFMNDLGDSIGTTNNLVVLGGDFNSKSHLWGNKQDPRGYKLADWLVQNRLEIANLGTTPTFVRRAQESVLDLTLGSNRSMRHIHNWAILDEETLSYHKMITFDLKSHRATTTKSSSKPMGWKINKSDDLSMFKQYLAERIEYKERMGANHTADYATDCITWACNQSFKRKSQPRGPHKEVYWWNEDIKSKRIDCLAARRSLTRTNKNGTDIDKEIMWQRYKNARKILRKAIWESKAEAWKRLISDLDQDIFGQAYRIVTNKLKPRTNIDNDTQLKIAMVLFPGTGPPLTNRPIITTPPPPFEEMEVIEAAATLKNGKAPGPDGISPEIARVFATDHSGILLDIANDAITTGRYPTPWKRARLVLIEKPRKNPTDNPTYRPICLLDTLGKILEAMICNRINLELERTGGLSGNQFGFRKGRSTIDAMTEVRRCMERGTRKRNTRGYCILVTIDVRNAFNSASWPAIITAMQNAGISDYLVGIVRSYLIDRTIIVGDHHSLNMTCGVPQGSKLGPLLWNIMYDGVLRVEVPEGANIIGFADDIGVVVTARTEPELRQRTEITIEAITNWLAMNNLEMAPEKTEAVLLAGRKTLPSMTITVAGKSINTKQSLKYLGVHFDKDFKMIQHVKETARKAWEVTRSLSRLMPNIAGPTTTKRQILNAVVNSVLLYGAPIWHSTMQLKKYRHELEMIQRHMAIRLTCAYRTISTSAAQILAGVTPIDLMVQERRDMYEQGRDRIPLVQQKTIEDWQARWENSTTGLWTKRLIPNIHTWITRKHGVLDFHLTQALSGHGCFQAYLHRIGKRGSPLCIYCREETDSAEHTLFACARWHITRCAAWTALGGGVTTPDNLVEKMLLNEQNWNIVQEFANAIISQKEKDEKEEEERTRMGNQ